MRTMAVLAALAAAAFLAAGCVTRVTARTRSNTDGSTESYVTLLGTGDKASDVASEGLFADGTRETLGAGVANAKASQQSTGVDGALAAAGNLFAQGVQAGMAAYGMRASSRARLTAFATWLWWRRHRPVIRRERILPRSDVNRDSVAMSL